jgi:hypothetical protein
VNAKLWFVTPFPNSTNIDYLLVFFRIPQYSDPNDVIFLMTKENCWMQKEKSLVSGRPHRLNLGLCDDVHYAPVLKCFGGLLWEGVSAA